MPSRPGIEMALTNVAQATMRVRAHDSMSGSRCGEKRRQIFLWPGVSRNPLKLPDSRKEKEGKGKKGKEFCGLLRVPEARKARAGGVFEGILGGDGARR